MDADESIKEGLRKRQSLNWTLKDGQNQYVEITEGTNPSLPAKIRAGWEEFHNQRERMSVEQQVAGCEPNLRYLFQKHKD